MGSYRHSVLNDDLNTQNGNWNRFMIKSRLKTILSFVE